jgi:hypothetical protein
MQKNMLVCLALQPVLEKTSFPLSIKWIKLEIEYKVNKTWNGQRQWDAAKSDIVTNSGSESVTLWHFDMGCYVITCILPLFKMLASVKCWLFCECFEISGFSAIFESY